LTLRRHVIRGGPGSKIKAAWKKKFQPVRLKVWRIRNGGTRNGVKTNGAPMII
jgi:hypothetical protein